ncbi:MAG: hypothetical protein RLZZ09_1185 [Pseudomonadota bacterium]|jgi:hypothetical protein
MIKFSDFESTSEKTPLEATRYQKPKVDRLDLAEVVQGATGAFFDDGSTLQNT